MSPYSVLVPPFREAGPSQTPLPGILISDQRGKVLACSSVRFASQVNAWCRDFLNPYVNYHRPCFLAESVTDEKGKTRKRYRLKDMMTPYQKLESLPAAATHLKPGLTFEDLDRLALAISDNEAARRLNQARKKLFESINHRSTHAA